MPERRFSANNSYRYGFNGKENDNEVKGDGTQLDYGARIYDTRLGRFLSLDPLQSKFPDLSPYTYAENNPLANLDVEGKYSIFIHFMLTRYMLIQAGVSEVQAEIIAHYASIYADNPGGVNKFSDVHFHSKGDVIVGVNLRYSQEDNPVFNKIGGKLSEDKMLWGIMYNPDIDYSRTASSQGEGADAQRIHATRTHAERNSVTAEEAISRSFTNAWALLFKSANEGGIKNISKGSVAAEDIGLALHTFQDIEAHRGAIFRSTLANGYGAISSDGNEHNINNDSKPDPTRFGIAQFFTGNAITVYQIMSGDFSRVSNGMGISVQGMNADQINSLKAKLNSAGFDFQSSGIKNSYLYRVSKESNSSTKT